MSSLLTSSKMDFDQDVESMIQRSRSTWALQGWHLSCLRLWYRYVCKRCQEVAQRDKFTLIIPSGIKEEGSLSFDIVNHFNQWSSRPWWAMQEAFWRIKSRTDWEIFNDTEWSWGQATYIWHRRQKLWQKRNSEISRVVKRPEWNWG